MNVDYVSLGKRIRSIRKQRNLTQQDLAEKAGITDNFLSKVERGDRNVGLDSVVGIANALQVPVDELLVDSLMVTSSPNDNDVSYLLLDCSKSEISILIRNMESLKEILRKYR